MPVYRIVLNVLPYFEVLKLRSSCHVCFQSPWLLDRDELRAEDASLFQIFVLHSREVRAG
jgi:hypothetical protein